jgi:hypothetical protein
MITFEKPTIMHSERAVEIVKMNGKLVGAIYLTPDRKGYFYKPMGRGKRGDVFDRLLDLRKSLEGTGA